MKKVILLCLLTGAFMFELNAQNDDSYKKFRVGGYGEMLYQYMDYGSNSYTLETGAIHDKRGQISIPRMVLAFDYKFKPDLILSSEIEFEYGGTGSGMELEYSEAGEYEFEIEKAGEVALEQFHITKVFHKAISLRVGHMIVPLGLTNAHHEPINFFGTSRPEGEMRLLPCTWHETGIALLGTIGDFDYQLMAVSGLDPNGFGTANWIRNGKQGIFELSSMNSPAIVTRLDYRGLKHTRIGISGYWNKSAKNASKPEKMSGIDARVALISADAQYKDRNFTARANVVWGDITDTKRLSQINHQLSNKLPFPHTNVAKNALTYSVEAGYNVGRLISKKVNLYPFFRYEYYNTMEKTVDGMASDLREKRDLFSVGANYYVLPNLVVKADWSHRRINCGKAINGIDRNRENTISVGVAYIAWFASK